MNSIGDNFKKSMIDGFFIVLPLLLFLLLLDETIEMLNDFVQPFAAQMPVVNIMGVDTSTLLAILLIILVLFVVGTIARTATGLRIGNWLSDNVLCRVPGFKLLQTVSRQFAGTESASLFAPAIVSMPLDTEVIAFITEEHGNGDYTILVPNAPTPMVGTVHYVRRERVRKIDAPLNQVIDCVMKWGIGSEKFFTQSRAQ